MSQENAVKIWSLITKEMLSSVYLCFIFSLPLTEIETHRFLETFAPLIFLHPLAQSKINDIKCLARDIQSFWYYYFIYYNTASKQLSNVPCHVKKQSIKSRNDWFHSFWYIEISYGNLDIITLIMVRVLRNTFRLFTWVINKLFCDCFFLL